MYVHLMPHPGFGWLLSKQKYLYLFIEDNKINQSIMTKWIQMTMKINPMIFF